VSRVRAWTVRAAVVDDHRAIIDVVSSAFSGPERDGRAEVDIVQRTWRLGASPPGLELVATHDGAPIAYVLGSVGELAGRGIVGVAPLAVTPRWQGRGVGTALMVELLRRIEAGGWPIVVVLGDPTYYGRFGFEPAGRIGISYAPWGSAISDFQACSFGPVDPGLRGEYRYCWELGGGRAQLGSS
jgi:putative acetyltransferase